MALISSPLICVCCNQWAHFPHIHFGLMPDQGLKKTFKTQVSKHSHWNPNLAVLIHAWKCSPDRIQSIKQICVLLLQTESPLLFTSCFLVFDLPRMPLKTCFSRMASMQQRQRRQPPTWASPHSSWLFRHAPANKFSGHAVAIAHRTCATF